MTHSRKGRTEVKSNLHSRNKHRHPYDFKLLIKSCPGLRPFVVVNKYNNTTIDFFNPEAVKMLNTALLKQYYNIEYWDIPKNYLCPPIPGRADYIHYVADLLNGHYPHSKNIQCLDIGTGANCIYPIIGVNEYGWSFIASETDKGAMESANKIIQANKNLTTMVSVRYQSNSKQIFNSIIKEDEFFDVTICNPPFHSSAEEAEKGSVRKLRNLKRKNIKKPILNFGGKNNELWCEGGEETFIRNIMHESKEFAKSCFWFTTLVSKQSNLKIAHWTLDKLKAKEVKTIKMGQGNKISRIVAWTFLSESEQEEWINTRWNNQSMESK